MKNTSFFPDCLLLCVADCLQPNPSSTGKETCSTMLLILSPYLSSKRIYSKWMNANAFDSVPLYNRLNPKKISFILNVIYSSILYICIYANTQLFFILNFFTFCYLSHFYSKTIIFRFQSWCQTLIKLWTRVWTVWAQQIFAMRCEGKKKLNMRPNTEI